MFPSVRLSQRFEGKYGRRAEIFFADVEVAGGADESEYAAAIVADHDDIERYPGGKAHYLGRIGERHVSGHKQGLSSVRHGASECRGVCSLYARYTPVAVAGVWKPFQT